MLTILFIDVSVPTLVVSKYIFYFWMWFLSIIFADIDEAFRLLKAATCYMQLKYSNSDE